MEAASGTAADYARKQAFNMSAEDTQQLKSSIEGLIAAAKVVARDNLNTISNLQRQLTAVTLKAEAEFMQLEAIERKLHSGGGL